MALPTNRQPQGLIESADINAIAAAVNALEVPILVSVYHNGTSWVDPDGNTISARPTAKRVIAFGSATQPSWLIAGDIWVQENA